jgi:transposase
MPNPKRFIPDSKIIELHCNGRSYTEIAHDLGISRQLASRVVRKYAENNGPITNNDDYRAAVKIEVTRENALSELSKQMTECTRNYDAAMGKKPSDEKAAYAWSTARRDLLDKMLKVTGLYNDKAAGAAPVEIVFKDA